MLQKCLSKIQISVVILVIAQGTQSAGGRTDSYKEFKGLKLFSEHWKEKYIFMPANGGRADGDLFKKKPTIFMPK